MATKPLTQRMRLSEARLSEVLADLGSQHERLGQASVDIARVLSEARASVHRAQGLLLDVAGQPLQPGGDAAAEMYGSRMVEAKYSRVAKAVSSEQSRKVSEWSKGLPDWAVTPTPPSRALRPWSAASSYKPALGRRAHSEDAPASRRRGGEALGPAQLPEGVLTGEYSSALELLEDSVPRPRVSVLSARRRPSGDTDGPDTDSRAVSPAGCPPRRATWAEEEHDDCAAVRNADGDSGLTDRPTMRSSYMSDGWDEDMGQVRRNAVLRMQARLGKRSLRSQVTPGQIYKAVSALGLVRYAPHDIEEWVGALQRIVAEQPDGDGDVRGSRRIGSRRRNSPLRLSGLDVTRATTRLWSSGRSSQSALSKFTKGGGDDGILFKDFADILLDDRLLSSLDFDHHQTMSLAIREVLCSGDANRLVAELTHVRVDDVAGPMDGPDMLAFLEPVVGVVTVLNGIAIGLQADEGYRERHLGEWFWANVGFMTFFVIEFLLRMYFVGISQLKEGQRWWTVFDATLIVVSITEIVLEVAMIESSLRTLNVMRFLRLVRLTRMFRILRLRYMKELAVMVKGLVGGLSTLFWAVILLFFMLYVIAVVATSTVGVDPNSIPALGRDELFSTVPKSFLTAFRCFMGDCSNSSGRPIVKLLADEYGVVFVMAYFACMIFVVFGLFNLIVAIYIENTLNAAKTEGDKSSKKQRRREAVRIAQLTRQLLKKFVAAQRLTMSTNGEATNHDVRRAMRASSFDDVGEITLPVSKEMFLCIIQDSSVQRLMDEMDIPPDRASLFDILDADGSGGLEVGELITGLLRVRGEAKKSDIVGTLLAVRCCQDMLREQTERMAVLEARVPTLRVQDASLASAPASRGLRKLARPRASVRHMLD